MLNNATAFSSLSTHKLLDTYLFYKDLLGFEVELVNDRFMHIYLPGGHPLVIYSRPDHQPQENTVLNFQIQNIEAVVDQLTHQGIEFLQYDEPFYTDSKGISWDDEGSHLAWFKDPGGNIIALIEH
ncbi:MAG: VOC family protein [Bacteroidota bacterium]